MKNKIEVWTKFVKNDRKFSMRKVDYVIRYHTKTDYAVIAELSKKLLASNSSHIYLCSFKYSWRKRFITVFQSNTSCELMIFKSFKNFWFLFNLILPNCDQYICKLLVSNTITVSWESFESEEEESLIKPQSNSHTFLARILQKWYISDTICKNLARILDFRQTCQILADQTFLADWDVSCKILAGQDISCKILGRILQDNVWNLKDILQENVWNVRETTRLFSNFKPGICSNWMWMSRICSRADLNVTKNFKPSKNFEPRTKPSWKKLCDACR